MARPVNANAEQTRRRILEVALSAFARAGFEGASTREIAGGAKVNIATLNHYFGSKAGLYDSAMDEVFRRIAARVAELAPELARVGATIGARKDEGRALEGLMSRAWAATRTEREGVRMLVRQLLDAGHLTERGTREHLVPSMARFAELVAGALGAAPARARAAVVTLSLLLSRFAIQDDASLRELTGAPTVDAAHAQVVTALAQVVRAQLG
jgi:AcrR family transcriptional regulator